MMLMLLRFLCLLALTFSHLKYLDGPPRDHETENNNSGNKDETEMETRLIRPEGMSSRPIVTNL